MPGILYHLAFAEEVYRNLPANSNMDKTLFMAGNLIPDLATDKKASHYRIPASVEGFFIPNMKQAWWKLYCPTNPLLFGMYCHLYLDEKFIESFLIPEFIWDTEKNMVTNPRNSLQWDVDTFFSHKGMYGSYTEINGMMLRDNRISVETVNQIPAVLPDTGIPVFDQRREKTWREELDGYLSEKKEYTGEIFDYNRLWNCISSIAEKFVEEEVKSCI